MPPFQIMNFTPFAAFVFHLKPCLLVAQKSSLTSNACLFLFMLSLKGCNSTHIIDVNYSFLKVFQVSLKQAGSNFFYTQKEGRIKLESFHPFRHMI